MKCSHRYSVFSLVLVLGFSANVFGEKTEWVRIPSHWLLSRFVRPSNAPARTYKVALVLPPGAKQANVTQSSGNSAVDGLANDFALESVRANRQLKDLAKTKELAFYFVVTPPMLDVKMRSKDGNTPIPPGKEFSTPTADNFYVAPNQNETASRPGKLIVIFPPQGGYASAALISVSTGNPAADRYYLNKAALDWQTNRKSSQEQMIEMTFSVAQPTRWQSILDR